MRAIRCSIVLVLLALAVAPAADASPPQPVTVDMHGHLTGPSTIEGTWTAYGAFTDSGTYTESFRLVGRTVHTTKLLSGARGTLQLHAGGTPGVTSDTFADLASGMAHMVHVGEAHD
jgi:hypothetical protein